MPAAQPHLLLPTGKASGTDDPEIEVGKAEDEATVCEFAD